MMKFKFHPKGISLPMTMGLLLLLITMTATINELVIRALRSAHQIEASDKAYFAAEAGIENALYELSAHTAGYETGADLGEIGVRNDSFSDGTLQWRNEWEIKNRNLNTCTGLMAPVEWELNLDPQFCGRLYEGDKLVLNLFTDDAASVGITTGQVNEASQDLHTLNVNELTIRLRVPSYLVTLYPAAFGLGLFIDNDGDLGVSSESGPLPVSYPGLNEDGRPDFPGNYYLPNTCPYSGGVAIDDNDCDLFEDEDSVEDPVVLWKVTDGSGHFFQPLRGCKGSPQHPSHNAVATPPGHNNAFLCENSFLYVNGELMATIYAADEGLDQDGDIVSLQSFLSGYVGSTEILQLEILASAPFQAINQATGLEIPLPYLEYGIHYAATDTFGLDAALPSTYFSLMSDGYYQDFKQSITTNVVPRATTQLLDLTIIQQ